MPISMIEAGSEATIVNITGNDETRQHLSELGFVVGDIVTVVNCVDGNVIVNVKGSRVALGKPMANRIMVKI